MPAKQTPRNRSSPAFWLAAIGFAALILAIASPVLSAAFDPRHDDDSFFHAIEGTEQRPLWNLWAFFDVDGRGIERYSGLPEAQVYEAHVARGELPWDCKIQHAGTKMWFFRPLPSLTVLLDHRLFGRHALGYHIHTLLWYVLAVWVMLLVYRELLGVDDLQGRFVSLFAVLVFVVDITHGDAIANLSTRHVSMVLVFGLLLIAAHVRWRERGACKDLALSLVWCLASLLTNENSMQVLAFLFAYELVVHRLKGLRFVLPIAAMVAGYVAFYVLGKYGAAGHGYLDVVHAPGTALRSVPERLMVYTTSALLLPPFGTWFEASFQMFPLHPKWLLALYCTASVVVLALFVRSLARLAPRRRTTVVWLSIGGFVALFPGLMGQMGLRLLIVPSLGTAAIVASISWWAAEMARDHTRSGSRLAHASILLACVALVGAKVVASAVIMRKQMAAYTADSISDTERRNGGRSVNPSCEGTRTTSSPRVLSLSSPMFFGVFPRPPVPDVIDDGRCTHPSVFWPLTRYKGDFDLARTAPNRIELSIPATGHGSLSFCGDRALDEVVALDHDVTIRMTKAEGDDAKALAITFADGTDVSSVWLSSWRDGAPHRVAMPDVGRSVAIAVGVPATNHP